MRTPKEKKKKLVISPDIMTLFDIEQKYPKDAPRNYRIKLRKKMMFSLANLATLGKKKKT